MDPLTMMLIMGGSSLAESILGAVMRPKMSKDVKGFKRETTSKGRELLARPGYGQDVIDAIFGKNFENIRSQGRTVAAGRTEAYGRAGMLGTGAEGAAARKDAWSNENIVSEAMRDLLISSEAKKSADIAQATQMLGVVGGMDQNQQQLGAGQGPALSEMVMTAMLMGMNKKPAVNPDEIGNLFGTADAIDNFSLATSRVGGGFGPGGSIPYSWLTR